MDSGRWGQSYVPKEGIELVDGKDYYAPDDFDVIDVWVPYTEEEIAAKAADEIVKTTTEQTKVAMQLMVDSLVLDDAQAIALNTLYADWVAGTAYGVGRVVNYINNLYRCIQAHTAQGTYTPNAVPALWSCISKTESGVEIWTQPKGATDAYAIGAVVDCGGVQYTSTINANVWAPGVYGWEVMNG